MTSIPTEAGACLPSLTNEPISRTTLALFAGGSGDHNPIHIDLDFARQAGMEDVFAHGMLSMAFLGQALTSWCPQADIRSFSARFVAITHVGEQITCSGKVKERFEESGEQRVRLDLWAVNADGDVKLLGDAVVAVE